MDGPQKPIKIKDSEEKKYLIIKPTHNKFNDLFVLLTYDVLKTINKTNLKDAIIKTINKWKYFTSDKNNELLSQEKQIGLIGELIFLNKIIEDIIKSGRIQKDDLTIVVVDGD